MRITTIGSKVLDDAIRKTDEIENVMRVTNISPFCFSFNSGFAEIESLISNEPDTYARKMVLYELNGSFLQNESDIYVIDLVDCRLHFLQIDLKGKVFRISQTNFTQGYLIKIKDLYGSSATITEYDPVSLSEKDLYSEVIRYVHWITKNIPIDKILLVDTCHVTSYISDNALCTLPSGNPLCKYNNFYSKLFCMFDEMLKCKCVPKLKGMYLKSFALATSYWNYQEEYYRYLIDAYSSYYEGSFDIDSIKETYEKTILFGAYSLFYQETEKQIQKVRNNRSVLVCADDEDIANKIVDILQIKEFSLFVSFDELVNLANNAFEENMVLFLPTKRLQESMLVLWNKGWIPDEDYLCLSHKKIALTHFTGDYYDLFGNEAHSQSDIDIEIKGICSRLEIRENKANSLCVIKAGSANHIYVGSGVLNYTYNNFCNKTTISSNNGCEILIEDDCIISAGTIIAGNDFCDISIKKMALLAAGVLVNNNLSDVWKWKMLRNEFKKTSICVGENVQVGFRAIILSNSEIEENTIIAPKSIVKDVHISID